MRLHEKERVYGAVQAARYDVPPRHPARKERTMNRTTVTVVFALLEHFHFICSG